VCAIPACVLNPSASLLTFLFITDSEIDIIYVHESRVVRTYVFDVRKDKDVENSVLFAQQQFLEEIQRKGYNALWTEGCVGHVFLP
jgi:hypothetical protein